MHKTIEKEKKQDTKELEQFKELMQEAATLSREQREKVIYFTQGVLAVAVINRKG